MKKSLVKEVAFGKATARITVTMLTEKKYWDGIDMGEENVITTSKVEIVVNGKVVASGYFARILEFDNITDTFYRKANLDATKKYTRVGDKALTEGAEASIAINSAIEEMKAELSKEFNVETEAEKQQKEEIEEAQAIVAQAEKEGIENLMTAAEIKVWRKRYNDMYNEGGEGYIPHKVSREAYQRALEVLGRSDIKLGCNSTRVSDSLIWGLVGKLSKMISSGNRLLDDYEQRIEYIYEKTKKELGEEVANEVKKRIMKIVSTYKETGVWDFVGAYK